MRGGMMRLVPKHAARLRADDRSRAADPYQNPVSKTGAQAALTEEPRLTEPRFTPGWRDPLRATGQIPELALRPEADEEGPALVRPYMPTGHPLDPRTPVEPAASGVIEDSLPGPAVPAPAAAAPVNFRADPVLYCGPDWARQLMALRVQSGEWEDLQLILERGWGRNAAEMVTARRHAREHIAAAARQLCAALGHPELTGMLLGRVAALEAVAGGAA